MNELEELSIKILTTVPAFKDMSWIEKEMFFGQHIYYIDDNGVMELDPREVIINLKEV
jgi:hypothetical protein